MNDKSELVKIVNNLYRKINQYSDEMKVKTDGDIQKSIGFLFIRAKNKNFTTQIRAVGTAIETMDEIASGFKT